MQDNAYLELDRIVRFRCTKSPGEKHSANAAVRAIESSSRSFLTFLPKLSVTLDALHYRGPLDPRVKVLKHDHEHPNPLVVEGAVDIARVLLWLPENSREIPEHPEVLIKPVARFQ